MGKTALALIDLGGFQKHPHLRGENSANPAALERVKETSPPTWGKQAGAAGVGQGLRNIPTYVGKTWNLMRTILAHGNIPTYGGKT